MFEGNADSQGEVSNAFIPPIIARYIRVTPQSWHQRVALKVALVGCQLARVRVPRPYGETLCRSSQPRVLNVLLGPLPPCAPSGGPTATVPALPRSAQCAQGGP